MEQPHLISRAAHGHIETSLIRQRREGAVPDVRGRDQRQEDDVSLITLKRGRPPAAQSMCLYRFGVEPLRKLVLDQMRLRAPLQGDDPDRLPLVVLVVDGLLDLLDDRRRLGPIENARSPSPHMRPPRTNLDSIAGSLFGGAWRNGMSGAS